MTKPAMFWMVKGDGPAVVCHESRPGRDRAAGPDGHARILTRRFGAPPQLGAAIPRDRKDML